MKTDAEVEALCRELEDAALEFGQARYPDMTPDESRLRDLGYSRGPLFGLATTFIREQRAEIARLIHDAAAIRPERILAMCEALRAGWQLVESIEAVAGDPSVAAAIVRAGAIKRVRESHARLEALK